MSTTEDAPLGSTDQPQPEVDLDALDALIQERARELVAAGALVPTPPAPTPLDVVAGLPNVPGNDEIRHLAQLAVTFAASDIVPKPLKQRPNDVFLVLMTARDIGLVLTTALRECHVIDGRVTISPKLKLALVRMRGLGRVWPHQPPRKVAEATPAVIVDGVEVEPAQPEKWEYCVCGGHQDANSINSHIWHAARADDPTTVYTGSYTWRDAQIAGLVTRACHPDDHAERCTAQQGTNGGRIGETKCKSNWYSYPGQMLQWRAMGYLMDQAFGEVATGLYSPDELGAITDEDGYIDIREVGPVEGLSDGRAQGSGRDPNAPAPQEDRDRITALIATLPDPAQADLRDAWIKPNSDGHPQLFPMRILPVRQVKVAEALVESFRARAAKGEWGPGWPKEPAAREAPASDPEAPADEPSQEDVDEAVAYVKDLSTFEVEARLDELGLGRVEHEPDDRAALAHHYAMHGLPDDEPDVDDGTGYG